MEAATSGSTSILSKESINSPGNPMREMVEGLRFAGRRRVPMRIPATTPIRVNNNLERRREYKKVLLMQICTHCRGLFRYYSLGS
jgi:hypothetical protein